jgi:DNA replication initiation complex subunit (GINS family)
MSIDLHETVRDERENDTLTDIDRDFYDLARAEIRKKRHERDEHEPHTDEAQRLNDEMESLQQRLDEIRKIRQRKINRLVFAEGKTKRDGVKKLARPEERYFAEILDAHEQLRADILEDGEMEVEV